MDANATGMLEADRSGMITGKRGMCDSLPLVAEGLIGSANGDSQGLIVSIELTGDVKIRIVTRLYIYKGE